MIGPDVPAPLPSLPTEGPGERAVDLLVCDLGGAACALPLPSVLEVCHAVAVTPLPGAPAVVSGVIDVRGRLVPVLDARARFGLPARAPGVDDHLIIARARDRVVALVVDRAHDVTRVAASQVERASSLCTAAESGAGIARLSGGLVVIHDLDAFLSAAEAGQIEAALASAAGRGAA